MTGVIQVVITSEDGRVATPLVTVDVMLRATVPTAACLTLNTIATLFQRIAATNTIALALVAMCLATHYIVTVRTYTLRTATLHTVTARTSIRQ
jgi:hypothetical protein